jgi:hypothetical protein
LPGTQISDDHRVLEHLALCVAAADPRQLDNGGFQHPRRFGIVAAAERCRARRHSRHRFAGRQAAVTARLCNPDALLQTSFVAGSGLREGRVEIGKGEAGAREMAPRMEGDLDPPSSSSEDTS